MPYFIRSGSLTGFPDVARDAGLDPLVLLREFGVPTRCLDEPDLMMPIDATLIDTRIGTGFGITALPHIQDVTIQGPLAVTGVSDTPSRQKVFTCRPTSAGDEEKCALSIAKGLTERAFRGSGTPEDLQEAMKFYDEGRAHGSFEEGIRMVVQGILANPRFVFRAERAPAGIHEFLYHRE